MPPPEHPAAPGHEWEPHLTEDASTCRRCGLTVENTLRAAGWDEELVKTPCSESPAATVDPRVRKDGLCAGANCRKPRTAHRNPASGKTQGAQKATRLNKKLWLYELEHDPFCSSRCARRYHGVVYQSDAAGDELTAARERAGQSAADRYRAGAT